MNRPVAVVLIAVCGLTGCRAIDGSYYPGCIAFSGDHLELDNGRVIWDKFTDQVRVDQLGRPIDPFPSYPKYGTYEVDDSTVYLRFDDSDTTETFHVTGRNGRVVLMTSAAYAEWQASGDYPQCVLTREEPG